MADLLDQRAAIRLLRDNGYRRTVGGTHAVKMVKSGVRPITLPRNRGQTYGKGLTHEILKEAGFTSMEEACRSRSPSARSSGSFWSEVAELPGCFASGRTLEELREALAESVGLYLWDRPAPTPARTLALGTSRVEVWPPP